MNKKAIASVFVLVSLLASAALAVSHPWHYQKDIIDHGSAYVLTQWKFVDKGWRPKVRPGRKWHGDFYPYDDHFDKWVIVETNAAVRPMSVPAHSVYRDNLTNLTAQVDALTPDAQLSRKARKDAENAEKHDAKNFANWLKDTFKARDKSTTEITNFYNDIIFFATNRVVKERIERQ